MVVNRSRAPMSLDRFREIQGKIVSRQEGLARKFIRENFVIENDQLIQKEKFDEMLRARKAPLGVGSKDPSEDEQAYRNYMATNLGFIQETTTSTNIHGEIGPTRFNDLQAYLMNAIDPFLWAVKSRQFGFSWGIAARGLAKAMLKLKHTTIFVSYNEEESKEKIVYARELHESMPMKWRLARRLKYDNKTSLVFEKSGPNSTETRILSYPQRIIRGKGGEVDICLDEFAHCIHASRIYTSATPALSRSQNSTLWIGSSPLGKGGLFYDIGANEHGEYNQYVRMQIPWWVVPEFCKDIETARKEAWDIHTDERVHIFATERIKIIRNSMLLEEFQQEYECYYIDEAYSYFPWDLINQCIPIFDVDAKDMPDYDSPAEDLNENDRSKSGIGIEHYTNFEDFLRAVRGGRIKGNILGGFDVGRNKDLSEIYYIEEDPSTFHQTCRCNISLKGVRLPEQERIVLEQIGFLDYRLKKFGVDYNGIGMQIAERLEELYPDLVVKVPTNSNDWKEAACRRFKWRLSKCMIHLPTDRRVTSQIHSIKRTLLPSGAWRFDVEANRKHHGDKFWALVIGSEVGHAPVGEGQEAGSFDSRVMNIQNDANLRQRPSAILTVTGSSSIMKHGPWGTFLPGPPSIPIALNIRQSYAPGISIEENSESKDLLLLNKY